VYSKPFAQLAGLPAPLFLTTKFFVSFAHVMILEYLESARSKKFLFQAQVFRGPMSR